MIVPSQSSNPQVIYGYMGVYLTVEDRPFQRSLRTDAKSGEGYLVPVRVNLVGLCPGPVMGRVPHPAAAEQ